MMLPSTAVSGSANLFNEQHRRNVTESINPQHRVSASTRRNGHRFKNNIMSLAFDEDASNESQDEWNVSEDDNEVNGSTQNSIGSESDEEDPIITGVRSRHPRSLIQVQSTPLSRLSREEVRHRLEETENRSDLELLYPPSLWKDINEVSQENSYNLLRETFEDVPLQENWREVVLENFCVYHDLDHKRFPGQYESLHTVASEQNKRSYLLDGILTYKNHRVVLNRLNVTIVSIGGLDLHCHSCNQAIWVQTKQTASLQGWFRLRKPAQGYQSIWAEFYWIANFSKYCLDYLVLAEREGRYSTLEDFKSDFMQKITQEHGMDREFKGWANIHKTNDMRRHMAQFGSFVYDQSYNIDLRRISRQHPLWRQVGCFVSGGLPSEEQTVVTRNTAATFLPSFPDWGPSNHDLLVQADCGKEVEAQRMQRMTSLQLPDKFSISQDSNFRDEKGTRISKVQWTLDDTIQKNRTVRCRPEQLLNKLVVVRQYDKNHEYFDFALVTSISGNQRTARIVWLTIPSSTICTSPKPGSNWITDERQKQKAYYPIGNELFFSDDCNCFSIRICDVVAVYNISILEEYNNSNCEFFAVTKYLESEQCFVKATRQNTRFMCRTMCPTPSVRTDGVPSDATCRRQRSSCEAKVSDGSAERPIDDSFTNVSLFSGCGLLDRALESTGKMRTVISIDCNPFAMCSAEANGRVISAGSSNQDFVVDSVNVELLKIMGGVKPYISATCMTAGCPCPGFSLANRQKSSKNSQRNCTLLASTMSWIEVTLPGYVVIENVPNMDYGSPSACSQAISFLVALGYQVRKLKLKASDFGGCTVRKRLFIIAAAPSYSLLDEPRPTHGNSDMLQPEVLIRHAVSDLPPIHNDTLTNIRQPYHIPLERLTANLANAGVNVRDMVHRIPTSPAGHSLATSIELMTQKQQQWARTLSASALAKRSQTMGRVDPDKFFSTIVTHAHWRCGFTGRVFHYNQDRLLSLEEVARAQGVPRDFILIGNTAQKLRQVGNAVPWCLRAAIGRELAKAYLRSKPVSTTLAVSEKVGNKERTMQSIRRWASKDGGDLQHRKVEEHDDDLVMGSEAEFNLAVSKRANTSSTLRDALTRPDAADPPSESLEISRKTDHIQPTVIPSIEQIIIEQTSTRSIPSNTNKSQNQTRWSTMIQKRDRSATELDVDDRTVKRRAKQLSMEAEMIQIGGSVEGDSDGIDAEDPEELVVRMGRLSSQE